MRNCFSERYTFDYVKEALRSLGVDVTPVFVRKYSDGTEDVIPIEEYNAGHRWLASKDLEKLKVGESMKGVMKISTNRYLIAQTSLF